MFIALAVIYNIKMSSPEKCRPDVWGGLGNGKAVRLWSLLGLFTEKVFRSPFSSNRGGTVSSY